MFAVPAGTAQAQIAPGTAVPARRFNIPPQSLATALRQFTEQSGVQVGYPAALGAGVQSPGVSGDIAAPEALSRLLTGTGLTFRFTSPNAVVLDPAPQAAGGAIQLGPVRVEGEGRSGIVAAGRTSDPAATEGTGSYTGSVTTTASRLPLTVRETPQSITIVTRDRMEDFQLLTVDSVLTSVVGITELRTESSRNSFVSRGFVINNFRVDGVDANYLNAVGGGRSPSLAFDSYLYDRIEVVRGATGLLSPTGDPSATINLVRKRPRTEFAANGLVAVGNRAFVRGGVDVSVPIAAQGGLRARLIGVYQDGDSWRDRASENRLILSGMVEYDATPTTLLRLVTSYEEQNAEAPSFGSLPVYDRTGASVTLPRSTNFATTWSRWDKSELRTDLTVEQKLFDDWLLTGVIGRAITESHAHLAFMGNGVPDAAGNGRTYYAVATDGERSQWTYDVSVQGAFDLFGRRHMVSLGANGYRQRDARQIPDYSTVTLPFIRSLGSQNIYDFVPVSTPFPEYTPGSFPTTRFDMDGVFGNLRFSVAEPLHVILGGRVTDWQGSDELITASGRTFSRNRPGRVFTPFGGATLDILPELSAYVSYADVFTPQSQRDVNEQVIGPIVGSNVEAGLKAVLLDGRLGVNAAAFEARLDNLAELVVPAVPLPDGSNAYRSTGKGNRTRGFEIEVNGAVTSRWNLYAGYARNRTRNNAGVMTNTQRPGDTVKFQTMWRTPVLDDRLSLGANVAWQGETYATVTLNRAPLRLTQEGYAVVGLSAVYDIGSRISVNLTAANILDKTYYTYAGNGYFGEPRTVRLTLTGRL